MPLLQDWQVAMSEQLASNPYHATMYPTATFTYVSRIDPLLALADAL